MKEKKPKKPRKLTKKELARKERFDAVCAKMEQDGYNLTELTLDAAKENALALAVMLPFLLVAVAAFALTFDGGLGALMEGWHALAFVLLILLFTVLHEGIHGLTWGCFAKGRFRSIDFGIIWQALAPYCTCSEPLSKGKYLLGGMMPTLVLGPALTIAACVAGSYTLLLTAIVMIVGGGGDFLVVLKILRHRAAGGEALFFDHPTELGLVVFEK